LNKAKAPSLFMDSSNLFTQENPKFIVVNPLKLPNGASSDEVANAWTNLVNELSTGLYADQINDYILDYLFVHPDGESKNHKEIILNAIKKTGEFKNYGLSDQQIGVSVIPLTCKYIIDYLGPLYFGRKKVKISTGLWGPQGADLLIDFGDGRIRLFEVKGRTGFLIIFESNGEKRVSLLNVARRNHLPYNYGSYAISCASSSNWSQINQRTNQLMKNALFMSKKQSETYIAQLREVDRWIELFIKDDIYGGKNNPNKIPLIRKDYVDFVMYYTENKEIKKQPVSLEPVKPITQDRITKEDMSIRIDGHIYHIQSMVQINGNSVVNVKDTSFLIDSWINIAEQDRTNYFRQSENGYEIKVNLVIKNAKKKMKIIELWIEGISDGFIIDELRMAITAKLYRMRLLTKGFLGLNNQRTKNYTPRHIVINAVKQGYLPHIQKDPAYIYASLNPENELRIHLIKQTELNLNNRRQVASSFVFNKFKNLFLGSTKCNIANIRKLRNRTLEWPYIFNGKIRMKSINEWLIEKSSIDVDLREELNSIYGQIRAFFKMNNPKYGQRIITHSHCDIKRSYAKHMWSIIDQAIRMGFEVNDLSNNSIKRGYPLNP